MAQDTDDINLTPQELQILSELDSRQFGFLKLNSPEQTKKKALVVRAIKYLERMLVQAQAEKQRRKADSTKINPDELKDDDEDKGISIDPKTYCKLGHFHLLLEDYSKAMSAYQKFYSLKGDYWKDASFLYGQGLVYYHFNAFQCATMAKKFWTIRQKRKSRRVSVEFKFLISRSLTMAFRQCHSVVERVEDQCPLLPGPSSMKDPTINESLMYSRQKKAVVEFN